MRRVTRPGGSVVASQWDFAQNMAMLSLFWECVLEVIATEAAREAVADCMVVRYPDEEALRRLWQEAGLLKVETERHGVDMDFASFEDYWTPFLSNVTPTSSYVGTLRADQAAEIKQRLRKKVIGDAPDRSFMLPAQAWAVRGKVPAE